MHEWERIISLPSKEKLEKPWKILENQDRREIGVFLGEKQRSIEREIDGNEDQIAYGLYIGKLIILDRCRYRQVSRYLSRRCWENTCQQLRCRGGIEDQHTSLFRTEARSIHQVSRSYRAYRPNLDRSTRYRGAGEIAIRKSLRKLDR